MSKPVVFVIGATGSIGPATVTALSAKYGDKLDIRAGVCNPDKADKLKGLPNVTVVKAEMGSPDFVSTLKGVDALYIVVPGVKNRAELTIETARAAKSAGVSFLLVVSALTADLPETISGRQFSEIEAQVKSLGVPHCFLRLPYFTDNFWGTKDSIKNQSSIYGLVDSEKALTPVTTGDAGNAAAVVLSSVNRHAGKTYNIVSHRFSFSEAAAAFSAAVGKDVKYARVSYEQARQAFLGFGMPEWQVDGFMELYKLMDSDSPVTIQADLSDYENITEEKPTSLQSWPAPIAGAFKLSWEMDFTMQEGLALETGKRSY